MSHSINTRNPLKVRACILIRRARHRERRAPKRAKMESRGDPVQTLVCPIEQKEAKNGGLSVTNRAYLS
jgi:hypothetical protein